MQFFKGHHLHAAPDAVHLLKSPPELSIDQKGDRLRNGVPGKFCTCCNERNWWEKSLGWHGEGRSAPEQIASLLRQVEVAAANGKMTPGACREGGITDQTHSRWRKEYGGLQVDQARLRSPIPADPTFWLNPKFAGYSRPEIQGNREFNSLI